MHISSEPDASYEARRIIGDAVDNHNIRVTGDAAYFPVNLFLRDDSGTIRGGVLADLWGGWLHVRFLWVEEGFRKQGYGGQLLTACEVEALAKGARHAHVETFSFQARPLYERHGYRVFGELNDYPPGHSYYYLRKDF